MPPLTFTLKVHKQIAFTAIKVIQEKIADICNMHEMVDFLLPGCSITVFGRVIKESADKVHKHHCTASTCFPVLLSWV